MVCTVRYSPLHDIVQSYRYMYVRLSTSSVLVGKLLRLARPQLRVSAVRVLNFKIKEPVSLLVSEKGRANPIRGPPHDDSRGYVSVQCHDIV